MKSYVVRTLGCKANLYDSQLLEAELQKRGWKPWTEAWAADVGASGPDLCVVNSCTVTDEADRQSRKLASRLARDNPSASVVITGCAAEVDPERLSQSKGIHYVIGNRAKPELVDLMLSRLQSGTRRLPEGAAEILGQTSGFTEMLSRHPMDREWPEQAALEAPPAMLSGFADKTRAFLKIQEGCNSFCTYCIIPYGRGPSRSLRPREILQRAQVLAAQGSRELILTGTNIGDYGADWAESDRHQDSLAELVKLLLEESGIERLRVSSLDPTEITPALMSLMESDPRFCPHFHVSLQSPSSKILRLMKRNYGYEQVRSCLLSIARLRGGQVFVGMDVITGFPGETAEDFEWTLEALRGLPWSRLHVFPYSERKGTPATRLPGIVPQAERTRRARTLQKLSLERLKGIYERTLREYQTRPMEGILLEKGEKAGRVPGLTSSYLRVWVAKDLAGKTPRNGLVAAVPQSLEVDEPAGEVSLLAQLSITGLSLEQTSE